MVAVSTSTLDGFSGEFGFFRCAMMSLFSFKMRRSREYFTD